MSEPRSIAVLWTSKVCYKANFTFSLLQWQDTGVWICVLSWKFAPPCSYNKGEATQRLLATATWKKVYQTKLNTWNWIKQPRLKNGDEIATHLEEGYSTGFATSVVNARVKFLKKKKKTRKLNSESERTILTERSPLVGEGSTNFCGYTMPRAQRGGSLQPYSRFSRTKPLIFLSNSSSVVLTRLSGPSSRLTTSQKIW
jgi:hypothetical protein